MSTENSSFSKINPFFQFAWDSTSLGELKTCPYKYYLKNIEGFRTKAESHHLTFGLAYHACLEHYDKLRAQGVPHEEAVLDTTHLALKSSGTYVVSEEGGKPKWVPWQTDISQKSRKVFVRTIIWYLDKFGENDPAQTMILDNGQPAVELSFRFEPGWKSSYEDIILCGHLDRVVTFQDQKWILDRKTTKSTISSNFFDQWSPENQMSLYSVAGKVIFGSPAAGVIIDGVQLAVGFSRFVRGFANRTPAQLEEWMDDTRVWISLAERFAETKHWPMNDKACSMYGGCVFRNICSKDPAVRQVFLESNFIREQWDPLKVRTGV